MGRTWSITVDGVELNNYEWSIASCPDIDNGFAGNVIWVPIAGDVPWYVRVQPDLGRYTVLVQLMTASHDLYAAHLATLRGLFAPGPHVLGAQVRGGGGRSIPVIADGGTAWNYQERLMTATLQAAQAG